ncbi:MAG TPA: hypothetical protein DER01_12950 [Phycisphaerales bacterium]|nr:hypothetical protein [Phycisphaerales bacterium]
MLCLSIRQPWAWLILNVGKDIENRSWPTNVRGRILIHASKGCTRAEYWDAVDYANIAVDEKYRGRGIAVPALKEIERGGIVGSVEIVDCVNQSESKWFMGDFGFVLRDPQILLFDPCGGRLGFFKRRDAIPPKELVKKPAPLFDGGTQ